VSQACNVPLVRARGIPEANPMGNMTASRLEARNGINDLRREIPIYGLSALSIEILNPLCYSSIS
jgi:hypothetical protein